MVNLTSFSNDLSYFRNRGTASTEAVYTPEEVAILIAEATKEPEWEYAVKTYPMNGSSEYTSAPDVDTAQRFTESWLILGKNDPEYTAKTVRRTKAGEWEDVS